MWIDSSNYYLLDPLPDELLFSTVARTARLMSSVKGYKVLNHFYNSHNLRPTAIVPFYLFEDPLRIFYQSIIPFYLSTYDLKRQQKVLTVVFEPGHRKELRGIIKQGFSKAPFKKKEGLLFCPLCLKEDTERYGMPYFHLTHQLEGVSACGRHGVKLFPYARPKQMLPLLEDEDFRPPEPAQQREIRYAQWAYGFKNFSDPYLRAVYHRKILEEDPKLFNRGYFYQALEAFFGYDYLFEMVCSEDQVNRGNCKVSNLIFQYEIAVRPIYHFMLWEFLGLSFKDFEDPIQVVKGKRRFFPVAVPSDELKLEEEGLGYRTYTTEQFYEKIYEFFSIDYGDFLEKRS